MRDGRLLDIVTRGMDQGNIEIEHLVIPDPPSQLHFRVERRGAGDRLHLDAAGLLQPAVLETCEGMSH
jgi:hypothetical protein